MAVHPNGDFVVVWNSGCNTCVFSQDGSATGVFGQRFAADGTPLGPEFRVNAHTGAVQDHPDVATLPGGGFVVVWQSGPCPHCPSSPTQDGDHFGIFGRVFDPAGNPGPEFPVNTYTTYWQADPAVAADGQGNFLVAWSSSAYFHIGRNGIYARRYDAAGTALGDEFTVDTRGRRPAIAASADGRFVVAWETGYVRARWWDSTASTLGPMFAVNTYTTGPERSPSVGVAGNGDFVVAWHAYGNSSTGLPPPDGSEAGVFARRFEADGTPKGDAFQVNTYTTDRQMQSAVAVDPTGAFLIGWHSGSVPARDVFAQAFDATGVPFGPEFRVSEYATGDQSGPALASTGDGSYIVTWGSQQDGSTTGVYARFLGRDLIFADGVEGGTLDGWSSTSDDGGDLIVSGAAALAGTLQGMQGTVDDTAGLFVQDDTPAAERRYRARFWIDPNGFDPGEAESHLRTRVFVAFQDAPTRRLMALVLKRQGGQYSLMGRARRDDGSQADTGFFPIGDEPHAVELSWTAASAPGANDGTFELWIDGTSVSALTGIDNDTAAVDFVRLGALSVKGGATGTLFWDEFESRRLSSIGP